MQFNPSLVKKIQAASVVSFDVFDTAILRAVARPRDAFMLVEDEAVVRFGEIVRGFADARPTAEKQVKDAAGRTNGAREATLEEIYAGLAAWRRLPDNILNSLKEMEIDAELRLARPNPNALELYEHCRKLGKRLVFLSDMYLPPAAVGQLLAACGYAGWERLFVSNEHGVSKRDGRLFGIACDGLGIAPRDMLHVGDDELSDVERAKEAGVVVHPWPRARLSAERFGAISADAPTTAGEAVASGLVNASLYVSPDLSDQTTADDFWRRFGYETVGPLYLGFGLWLADRLAADGVARVYFLSRDGWIMERVYRLLRERRPELPEPRYLAVSRHALAFARLAARDEEALAFFARDSERRSVGHYLRRVGLDPVAHIDAVRRSGFDDADFIVEPRREGKRIRRLLDDLFEAIRPRAEHEHALAARYLRQMGLLDSGRPAVVDIGWQGGMQDALEKFMRSLGAPSRLRGYYLGTFAEAAASERRGEGKAGFLCDFGRPAAVRATILKSVPLFEFLHSAPHGSIAGYLDSDGEATPRHADNFLHEQWALAEQMQAGALAFIADFLEVKAHFRTLTLSREAAFAPIEQVIARPTLLEAKKLGDIRHVDSFDDPSSARFLARPPAFPAILNPKGLRRAYLQSLWRPGFIRRLAALGGPIVHARRRFPGIF
ncbi:MAG: hypothetical protein C4523_03820 [Myxococcales bacterium]|nr:MAG: hypothetical protein C4523_03820 [Myxococcales bacterium]